MSSYYGSQSVKVYRFKYTFCIGGYKVVCELEMFSQQKIM